MNDLVIHADNNEVILRQGKFIVKIIICTAYRGYSSLLCEK